MRIFCANYLVSYTQKTTRRYLFFEHIKCETNQPKSSAFNRTEQTTSVFLKSRFQIGCVSEIGMNTLQLSAITNAACRERSAAFHFVDFLMYAIFDGCKVAFLKSHAFLDVLVDVGRVF